MLLGSFCLKQNKGCCLRIYWKAIKMENASAQDQMNCMKIVEALLWLRSLKLKVAALLRLIDHALFRT